MNWLATTLCAVAGVLATGIVIWRVVVWAKKEMDQIDDYDPPLFI